MKLSEWKSILLNVFVILLVFTIGFGVYGLYLPFDFPGLTGKFAWALLSVGAIALALYVPYGKAIPKLGRFYYYVLKMTGRSPKHKSGIGIPRILPRQKESFQKKNIKKTFDIIFQILLVVFLLLLLVQQFDAELVESVLEINYLLTAVVIFGAVAAIFQAEDRPKKEDMPGRNYYMLAIMAGLFGGGTIWLAASGFSLPLRIVTSILAGTLIIITSVIIAHGDEVE